MYRKLTGVAIGLALMCATPSLAAAAPGDSTAAQDAATNAALIAKAERPAVACTSFAASSGVSTGLVTPRLRTVVA